MNALVLHMHHAGSLFHHSGIAHHVIGTGTSHAAGGGIMHTIFNGILHGIGWRIGTRLADQLPIKLLIIGAIGVGLFFLIRWLMLLIRWLMRKHQERNE